MRLLRSALFIERLIAAFGPRNAARLYLARAGGKLRGAANKNVSSVVRLNGYSAPIHLRFATSDWNVLEQIFISREYEDPTEAHAQAAARYYEKIRKSGDTPLIIDCGANIGLAALWYARKYPAARIISIEPEPANFAILCENVAGYSNIVPVRAAVASSAGRLTLANASGAPWAWTTERSEEGEIASVTINELLRRQPGGSGFIVKVDIEGFESDLFSDNTEWITEFPILVAESHDYLFPWKGTAHPLFAALVARGPYDFVQKGENCFCYAHVKLKPRDAAEVETTTSISGEISEQARLGER